MIKNITFGQYIPGGSVLHRADPRVKIILVIVFMISVFIANSYLSFALNTVLVLTAIFASRIPFVQTLKGLKPILFLIAFTFVINLFTTGGAPVFQYKFISISYEGIAFTVKMALRLILLVMSASLLTYTTTPISLTDGMESLMKPLKRLGFPAHEIAMMMAIALRFIPTLLEETDKIMKAQASRGADFDTGSFINRAKSFVPVLVPLFVSAFRRADDLAIAMEARCYKGGVGRTRMKQLRLGTVDYGLVGIMAVFVLIVGVVGLV